MRAAEGAALAADLFGRVAALEAKRREIAALAPQVPLRYQEALKRRVAELGVSLLPQSLRQLSVQGVVWRPLRRSSVRAGLAVAHRRGPVSQMVLNFAQVARAMAHELR